MPGRLTPPPPTSPMSHMLMHMLVRQCIPPHEGLPDPHDSMQSFRGRPNQGQNFIPTTSPVIPSITHTKQQSHQSFWASRPCDRSLTRFMPFTKPPSSQKKRSGIGSKRRYFGVQTTRRARPSDSPGREGYKETSGEGRSRGCHHVEEKRLRRIPLQKSPIVHRRLSWFVIVQDKWKEVRGKIEKEEKEI